MYSSWCKSEFFIYTNITLLWDGISTDTETHRFTPLLAKKSSPNNTSRVLATASIAGLGIGSTGKSSVPAYTASKAAVIHLVHHLCVDLGDKHITCNAIAPGFFPTKMANGLIEMGGGIEKLAKEVPMGRLGKPEDIAGVVVFLSSKASEHINGATITLDGGRLWGKSQL